MAVENEKFQELVLQQLKAHTEGQNRLEERFDGLEERFDGLEQKVDRLELRMENEVIDKLRALFDDREVQNDRLDRIESRLESLSTDVSYLVAKTATLKMLAK